MYMPASISYQGLLCVIDKESGIESQKPKSFRKDKVKSLPSLLLQFAASSSDQEKGISSQVLRIYTKSVC